jgi:hexosaminidase
MLIPRPARLTRRAGSCVPTGILAGPGTHGPARLLAAYTGLPLVPDGPAIRLARNPGLGPEEYTLEVTPGRALLTASTDAGLLAGVQTIRQLHPRLP